MLLQKNGVITQVDARMPQADEVVWLHLENPDDASVHHLLGEVFYCHPLAIEDVMHFGQRSKLDHYAYQTCPQAFMSFYAIRKNLTGVEFSVILSNQFVITVVREKIPEITRLYERAAGQPEFMEHPATIVYHLLDACVDGYLHLIDGLEDNLDKIEQLVFNHPERQVAADVFRLKRKLQRVRRLISDGRNVIGLLSHEAFPYTDAHHQVYFIDVYDHASRVVDALDTVRDNLSGLLDLQTSQRANRMNEVMKTLTIISVIFLPLSFIVGLYGMNLKNIPEYQWSFGYAYVWLLLLSVTTVMVVYFKRKGWW